MVSRGNKGGTTRFSHHPAEGTRNVFVAGDFTGWEPKPMRRKGDGQFVVVLPVPPGEHEYKFVVDGQWITDPDNASFAMNPFGGLNSVVTVKPPRRRRPPKPPAPVWQPPQPAGVR